MFGKPTEKAHLDRWCPRPHPDWVMSYYYGWVPPEFMDLIMDVQDYWVGEVQKSFLDVLKKELS